MAKSRILFSACFLILLPLAAFTGDRAAWMALYALGMLFVLALASAALAPFTVRAEGKAAKSLLFKNEELPYSAAISGKLLFLYSRVDFAMYDDELVRYEQDDAQGGFTGKYVLRFPYRGSYRVGFKSVTVTDFVGLFRFTFPLREYTDVLVFPEKDESFTLSLRAELMNREASSYDMFDYAEADVSDVRKYVPSDDYRKIHWKLTAKKNEFIVKNFHSAVLNKTVAFLDTRAHSLQGREKLAFEDKVVSLAASALNYLVKRRLPAELVYGEGYDDAVKVDTLPDLNRAFHLLAGLEFQSGGAEKNNQAGSGLEKILGNTLTRDAGLFNAVIFLTGIDGALAERLNALLLFGHGVIVYYVSPRPAPLEGDAADRLEKLRGMGAEVHVA